MKMKACELQKHLQGSKEKTVADLARFMQMGDPGSAESSSCFCLLLGAGASRASGIQTGAELIAIWRKQAFNSLCPNNSGEFSPEKHSEWLKENTSWYDDRREYSTLFEYHYPLFNQRRKFIAREIDAKVPSIGYAYLVRLAESGFLRTIFTTNFDDLLSEAFYQFSVERPIVCAHDSSVNSISITSPRTKIIKMHGDCLFYNIKATASETADLALGVELKLKEFVKEYGLIVSGYSGGDKSVTEKLSSLMDCDDYFKYGLYWCFRPDDEVRPDVLDVLKKENSFYVIVDGFDPLMAELYSSLCGVGLPFNSKIASDRAAKVIASYLNNDLINSSQSETIKKHISELEKDLNSSLLVDAIRDIRNDADGISENMTDREMIVYLGIQRFIINRDFEGAISKINEELSTNEDKNLRKVLLERLYYCNRMLYRRSDAIKAIDAMHKEDPSNPFVLLNKCKLLIDADTRLDLLRKSCEMAPFNSPLQNHLCAEMRKRYISDPNETKRSELIEGYKKSITLNPRIGNTAWGNLYDFISDGNGDRDVIEWILDEHLKQDAYSALTTELIYQYCRERKQRTFRNRDLFELLDEAFNMHFPKTYAAHFEIYSKACLQFQEGEKLVDIMNRCKIIPGVVDDEDFIIASMEVAYDFYRDVNIAIRLGESYLKNHRSSEVERKLFEYNLVNKDISRASDYLNKLRGFLSENSYIMCESEIIEAKGWYVDAINKMKDVPDKDNFDEKFSARISYLYLKANDYDSAKTAVLPLLKKHNFSLRFEAEIINYEISKNKTKNKIDKNRVSKISDNGKSQTAKAVALLMLGKEDEAFSMFENEIMKRYSNIDLFLEWPGTEPLHERLTELKNKLSQDRRGIDRNMLLYDYAVIDV